MALTQFIQAFGLGYISHLTPAEPVTFATCSNQLSSHGIAQDGDALSTHAVARLLMTKTQVDPELTGNSTHICMCSADCCYSYTMIFQLVFVQRVYKISLPAYFSPV